MEPVRWDYRIVTLGNVEIPRLTAELRGFGAAGWELISLSSTVKKLGYNELLAIFKRPGVGPVDLSAEPVPSADGWM